MGITQAAKDVLAERKRQIEVEGWTPGHDDEHRHGEIAVAAACYAVEDTRASLNDWDVDDDMGWPWGAQWWKPSTRRQNLIKAGALILAEIERLDRAVLRDESDYGAGDCVPTER